MADSRNLEGHTALVTGAARNVGRSIALELARAGARVVVHARSSVEAAQETVALCREAGGGEAAAFAHFADLTDPAAVDAMFGEVEARFGRLDLLVHNAAERADGPFETIGYDEWRRIVSSILDSAFLCDQAALPLLRRSAAASIVHIGGVAAHVGVRHRAHVSAAKAGIAGLTRALAAEFAAENITVNCISPAQMATERKGPLPEHFVQRPVPMGRPGEPVELAKLVCFLAGPFGRFITGQTLHLNGGWYTG
ncbi:SDR family oxidoreductase [Ancylobacter sp. MQZ15Z-1]|uniref:SDR family oxidoreductase n=1 Tax=Ancylobacter mangrovi TaxID=2972472 RepID=A0A9X2T879_9HYPH|nr:SDR family oxidoreductase [Ancylobacter mangrovi]MCS0496898.1 SDR family oxidoreductase [Ancylobacter mangrovi]